MVYDPYHSQYHILDSSILNHISTLLTMNLSQRQSLALDTVLPYATLENFIYLSGTLIVLKLVNSIYTPLRKLLSPLRHLSGPKNASFIFGNLAQLLTAQQTPIHEGWFEKYGSTFAFRGLLSVRVIALTLEPVLTFLS